MLVLKNCLQGESFWGSFIVCNLGGRFAGVVDCVCFLNLFVCGIWLVAGLL